MKEVVYTPQSELLSPGRFVGSMFRDLLASRELALCLFLRDFSARYRQSFLGYIWVFVPPLATTITFVFLRSQGLFTTGQTSVPYPAYVIIGMLFWQVFVDAIQCPLKAVTAAKAVLSKIQFPPEAILLAGLGEVLFSFLVRLLLVAAVFVWYHLTLPVTALLLPVSVGALLILGFTLGVLVTPLGVLYTDVTQSLSVVTTFWLFLTPVIYPARDTGLAGWLSRWNPVSPLLIVGRDWLIVGKTTHLTEFIFVSVLSLVVLLGGWVCYRVAMPHLITRIGN
jgi:lipopolysaccharide transport system permease protein